MLVRIPVRALGPWAAPLTSPAAGGGIGTAMMPVTSHCYRRVGRSAAARGPPFPLLPPALLRTDICFPPPLNMVVIAFPASLGS
jgi:hypothetical protein